MHSLIDGLADDAGRPNSELSMAADVLASLSPDENPARADALGVAFARYVASPGADEHWC